MAERARQPHHIAPKLDVLAGHCVPERVNPAPYAFNPGSVSQAIQQLVHTLRAQVALLAEEDMAISLDVGTIAVDVAVKQAMGLLTQSDFPLLSSFAVNHQVRFVQGDVYALQRQIG